MLHSSGIRSLLSAGGDQISRNRAAIHNAWQQSVDGGPFELFVKASTESCLSNVFGSGSSNEAAPLPHVLRPSSVLVPALEAFKDLRGIQLAVVGYCHTTRCGRVQRHDHDVLSFSKLSLIPLN